MSDLAAGHAWDLIPVVSLSPAIGLGCMRLSTAADRDEARSIAVIHAALDSGVTFLDTSDAYCHADRETGHNERLIAKALASWPGDRSTIEVATKGGLRRIGRAWVTDGRAKHLRAACEGSLRALGVESIDLYQLHSVDPKTPLETSIRALAALQADGKIRRIGLCNVTVSQIKAARAIAEVAAVQVSLSVFDDESLRNGVAEYCRDEGIRLIAYRPLGGERARRLAREVALVEIAARHGVTAHDIALAWLMDLSPLVLPIPGATRIETARAIGNARRVRLDTEDRRALDTRAPGWLLRTPRAQRRPAAGATGEVVLVMGMPGAGKSSVARELESHGFTRLNRDERGGSLSTLVAALDAGLSDGQKRWVLDNTYPSRKARNEVIECAWKHGVPVRCVHMRTSVADAQINAITRLIAVHGRLPTVEELRERGREDARYFGPDAQFRYERTLETPELDEGFVAVEARDFHRDEAVDATQRAVVIEYDEVLFVDGNRGGPALRAPDVTLVNARRELLRRLHEEGWLLFAHAWRPQVARGELMAADVGASFARARELAGVPITFAHCPHDAGPPICWCRKPLPGLILEFAIPQRVALARSMYVGRAAADRTLAQRLGMSYVDAGDWA